MSLIPPANSALSSLRNQVDEYLKAPKNNEVLTLQSRVNEVAAQLGKMWFETNRNGEVFKIIQKANVVLKRESPRFILRPVLEGVTLKFQCAENIDFTKDGEVEENCYDRTLNPHARNDGRKVFRSACLDYWILKDCVFDAPFSGSLNSTSLENVYFHESVNIEEIRRIDPKLTVDLCFLAGLYENNQPYFDVKDRLNNNNTIIPILVSSYQAGRADREAEIQELEAENRKLRQQLGEVNQASSESTAKRPRLNELG